jgi:hypothetical protein
MKVVNNEVPALLLQSFSILFPAMLYRWMQFLLSRLAWELICLSFNWKVPASRISSVYLAVVLSVFMQMLVLCFPSLLKFRIHDHLLSLLNTK